MNIGYRPVFGLRTAIELDDHEQFLLGGLKVKSLIISDSSIAIGAHTVLGDGTLDPREKVSIIHKAGFDRLPAWVLAFHDEHVEQAGQLGDLIDDYLHRWEAAAMHGQRLGDDGTGDDGRTPDADELAEMDRHAGEQRPW